MGVLKDLRNLSAAEDIFRYLGVDYDPGVLNVARLHILRSMGEALKPDQLEGEEDDQVRAICRARLVAAYATFVTRSPLEERLFKVHKDAISDRSGFVPLQAILKRHEHRRS